MQHDKSIKQIDMSLIYTLENVGDYRLITLDSLDEFYHSHFALCIFSNNALKFCFQDFTWEQDSITPVNGWKAYYAATRAIVNINTEFFNIIRDKSIPAMSRFWLNADYVKCIHASGELFSGYEFVS